MIAGATESLMPELKDTEKALKLVNTAYLTTGSPFLKRYTNKKKRDGLDKARKLIAKDLEKNNGDPMLTEGLRYISRAVETWKKEVGVQFGSDEFLKLVQEESENWRRASEIFNANEQGRITKIVNGWYNQTLAHTVIDQGKWKEGSKILEKAGEEFYGVDELNLTLDMVYRAALVIVENTRHKEKGAKILETWAQRFDNENRLKLAAQTYYLAGDLYGQKVKNPKEAYRNFITSAKRARKARYITKALEAYMEAGTSSIDRVFKWAWDKIRRR